MVALAALGVREGHIARAGRSLLCVSLSIACAGAVGCASAPQPVVVEARRITGQAQVKPDPPEAFAIAMSRRRVVAVIKLCLDERGKPKKVKFLQSTGYDQYDFKIATVMSTWRYSPLTVDGVPTPVCTSVTIIYGPRKRRGPTSPMQRSP